MNKYLEQLVDLSNTDREIDDFGPRIEAIEKSLKEAVDVQQEIQGKVNALEQEIKESELKKSQHELHLTELSEKIAEISKKTNVIKTEKEQKALQLEEEICKEQCDFSNEEIERLDTIIASKKVFIEEAKTEIESANAKVEETRASIAGKMEVIEKERTSVYDFYPYFRNVNDVDVKTCLSLLTFLPMDEIEALCAEGANINEAKRVLAYTVTSQVHGEDEAKRAEEAALALFGGKGDLTHMPTVALSDADIEESGMSITRLLVLAGIEKSNSAAIRSVREGGISVNDRKVTDTKAVLDSAELADGIILKKGKKTFVRLIHKD